MKTFLTLVLPTLIVVTGVASILFFEKGRYNLSAFLTLTGFLSASLWVYVINNKKAVFA